ncbi:MAG: recombinase family protein [Glaciimonas sp.]|nr:recombinase family protein [Glaciimonas sp.]
MLINCVRVSTQDQNFDLQHEALTKAWYKKIFGDKISGGRAERPGLNKAVEMHHEGDTLATWSSFICCRMAWLTCCARHSDDVFDQWSYRLCRILE